MCIRILHLWANLLFITSFSYASDTAENLEEHKFPSVLQTHIYNTSESYKLNVQSKKYSFGTFSEIYTRTLLALEEYTQKANDFLNEESEPLTSIEKAEELRTILKSTPSEIYAQAGKSQKKVGTLRKNLFNVIEVTKAFKFTFEYVSSFFQSILPDYSQETYNKAAQLYIALYQWREKACKAPQHVKLNDFFSKDFIQTLLENIHQTGSINLISFVCPPIDFNELKSETPENYLLPTIENSLISKHIPYFRLLIEDFLIPTKIDLRLTFLIGDSDEDDYIWGHENLKPIILDEEKLNNRRRELLSNIKNYVSRFLPLVQINVYSLHDYHGKNADTETYQEILDHYQEYFSTSDVETEKMRMIQLWENDNYYSGLSYPGEEALNEIIKAKFAAYAVHGLIAHDIMPTAILCQTEFPPRLRTKMLNAGRKYRKKNTFSALYLLNESDKNRNVLRNIT